MNQRISVIVPAYNIESYLEDCLDSILAQTYRNIEIIVVDDGSTDRTGEIADSYASRFPDSITCLHGENAGVLAARLKGIQSSKGDWIGFVDGDDQIEPDMYERLLQNALHYEADISHCGYQTIVNNGERIHYFYNTGRFVKQDHDTGLKDLLEGKFVEPGLWNKLYSRALVFKALNSGKINTTIFYTEDRLLNWYLFQSADSSIYEDFCPYHYMARITSATRIRPSQETMLRRTLDPLRVWKIIYAEAGAEFKLLCEEKLIVCEVSAYFTLRNIGQKKKALDIRNDIILHRGAWKRLGKKERIRLYMVLYVPWLYQAVYSVYEKFFQKKVYE